MMYRSTTIYIMSFLGLMVFSMAEAARPVPSAPAVNAKAYFMLDFHSGRVLAKKNADERVEPASLTKIMTAYVAAAELLEGSISMNELTIVSEKAWRTPGSKTFIEAGKEVSVENLLMGIIVQSGNDASIALAEHISGGEDTFAQLMNYHAQQLGLDNTHFVNCTGLPDPNHYTTARDISILTAAFIRKFPEIYSLFSVKEFTFNQITQPNRNRMLWRDETVDGVKTGYTEAAGYCLVASAEREGMRLISSVLGSSSVQTRTEASQSLMNYGFRFFETHRLYDAFKPITKVRVFKGKQDSIALGVQEQIYVTIPRREYKNLSATMSLDGDVVAPVTRGEAQGTLKITLEDAELLNKPLIVLNDVPEGGLFTRLADELRLMRR